MEMKQISETTLKITISMEDLEERGMELKDFLIPQEKTEEFFYTVMDELDLPDNFKNSGMLSFRVTPKKDRLDVFVTKSEIDKDLNLEDLANFGDVSQMSPDEFFKTLEKSMLEKGDTEAHEKLKQMEEMVESAMSEVSSESEATVVEAEDEDDTENQSYTHYVLSFPTLKEAVVFSKAIDFEIEASELYKLAGQYYMTILVGLENKPAYYANLVHARLLEHSQNAQKTRAYLQEHGIRLIDGYAVTELEGIKVR
ncbi:adaptor protein MecA [Streptococcus jiangjianxini]|uniref:adaptor protein MecA n=1 Tax=Streptococcus jiangjianxini TaxID=3161189 RepID=UPI0032EAB2EE